MNKIVGVASAFLVISSVGIAAAAPLSPPLTMRSGFEVVNGMTMTTAMSTKVNAQPVSSSKVVSTLAAGTKVTVLDKTANGKWAHVQVGTSTGYVLLKTLK
jgi:uncharacterized protein YgiM (DUF1202 family)